MATLGAAYGLVILAALCASTGVLVWMVVELVRQLTRNLKRKRRRRTEGQQ
ncbi:hypothetical protein ACH47B_06620 [Rhodococcus sp. NPDC019627]|uniref:hypothetical protein n=1 Tax=unclassified Rhodococcus (in: high G+C Gram-positive bacteria) TaxID=192944 RepID=UPI0037BCFFA6